MLRKYIFVTGLIALLLSLSGCKNNNNIEKEIETEARTDKIYESWHDEMQSKVSTDMQNTVKNINQKNRTWYEIFVYSFNDTNNDGIGDLNGITEVLDYIEYMGFSGIWLTPVHPSTTYHKYDVTDYYAIDPQYGTMEDFENLVDECNKRGIAVIMDLVLNHTSSQHEWFKEAVSAVRSGDIDNKYINYYNIADKAGNGQWQLITDGWYYECQFWSEMPDLNLENEEVRVELEDVFKFWLDKGISGFRLDAVKEYVTGNTEKNIEILSWVNQAVKSINPEAYLVGEAWEANTGLYEYYRSGIDSFFNFNFAMADGKLAKTLLLKNQTASEYAEALLTAQNMIKENNPEATDAPFFTNHDTARAGGFLRRDINLIKMAWGMNLMQSGNAFVYYGEEIGMSGSGIDPNKRAPMLWADSNIGVTYGPPGIETKEYPFDSVMNQLGEENSILEFIRKAVIIRNKYPEIAAGEMSVGEITVTSDDNADKVCLINKSIDDSVVSLYYNFSDKPVKVISESEPSDWLSASGDEPAHSGNELELPKYSIVIVT